MSSLIPHSSSPDDNWAETLLAEQVMSHLQKIPLKIEADLKRDLIVGSDRDSIIQKTVKAAQAIFDATRLWEDLLAGIKEINSRVSDIESVINTLFLTTLPNLIRGTDEQVYLAIAIQSKKRALLNEISKIDNDVVEDLQSFLSDEDEDEKIFHRPPENQFADQVMEDLQEIESVRPAPLLDSSTTIEGEMQSILTEVERLIRLRNMEWKNRHLVLGIYQFLFKHEKTYEVIFDYREKIAGCLDDNSAQKTLLGKKMDLLFSEVFPAIMKSKQFQHFTIYIVYTDFLEDYSKIHQRYVIREEEEKKVSQL